VYQGVRIAQIASPNPNDRITIGQTLQIVGSAQFDDFANYTLDFGPGDNPSTWTSITDQRDQGVDKALLGVWNTSGLEPGRYRLRLRILDSVGNVQESPPVIVTLSPPATPTPQPTATPAAVATPTRGPTAAATQPARQPTPQPTRPATPRPTPKP
jgi:hypothetical protein